MTEFWKSTKKWHCKYCDIHIDDNAPSKQLHETGFRHIGNKERHLRNVYKTGEKKKKDADEEKREIDRLEKAAERAYALDLASGAIDASAPPPASSSKPAAAPKPKDKFSGYTTAADLGFIDPDVPEPVDTAAEEAAAQAKLEGRVGQWSFVAAPSPPPPEPESAEVKRAALGAYAGLSAVSKGDHDDDAKESREFKFVRKEKRPLNWGADDDAGEIKVKVKEKEEGLMAKKRKKEEQEEEARLAREQLVWKPVAWGSKLGEGAAAGEERPREELVDEKPAVKAEEEAIVPEAEESKPEVEVHAAAPTAPIFKKRRGPPAGVGKKPKF